MGNAVSTKSKVTKNASKNVTKIAEIKIWDSGSNSDDRYTILCGNKAFIFGNSALEDARNMEVISGSEINIEWMDANYKKTDISSINITKEIAQAIKSRL